MIYKTTKWWTDLTAVVLCSLQLFETKIYSNGKCSIQRITLQYCDEGSDFKSTSKSNVNVVAVPLKIGLRISNEHKQKASKYKSKTIPGTYFA